MNNLGKMLRANNDEEALKFGKPMKIWNGTRWLLGILYKRPEQEGTQYFSVVEV